VAAWWEALAGVASQPMATMQEDFEALGKAWREAVEVARRDPTFHVYLGVVYATVVMLALFHWLT
jgi:hypothetical protein